MPTKNKKIKNKPKFNVPLMRNAFIEEKKTRKDLANFILNAEILSMGEQCANFEEAFAKEQGRKDAILFNSGSSANLAIIQSMKNLGLVKEGDKIGFSALTWSTNVMPIIQMGFKPIPIDCNPRTLNAMCADAIEILKKENCKVFFLTNVLGLVGDISKIEKECKKAGIIVIEDNCESLGTEIKEGKAGNFSLAASFSFFVAHHMSTIEGGMVVTDDHAFAEMLRIVRAHGWDRNLRPERQKYHREKHGIESDFHARYSFYDLGYNLRPTEITGFLGLSQLKFLRKGIKTREKNFHKVQVAVEKNDDFIPLQYEHITKLSAFALPFVLKTKTLKEKYVKIFQEAGIEVRPMIAGNIQNQPFYKKYMEKDFHLPGAESIHHNGFYCSNDPELTDKDIKQIISCLKKVK